MATHISKPSEVFDLILASSFHGIRKALVSDLVGNEVVAQDLEAKLQALREKMKNATATISPDDTGMSDKVGTFFYVHQLSQLVFLHTVLDTFLSDVTKLLLTIHPGAISPNQQISMQSILQARSTSEVLNQAISKKNREISGLSIVNRLEFLKEKFGIIWEGKPSLRGDLETLAAKRNTIIHDQGGLEITLNEELKMQCRHKGCVVHPTPIWRHDITQAITTTTRAITIIARSIYSHVLKMEPTEQAKGMIEIMEQHSNKATSTDPRSEG